MSGSNVDDIFDLDFDHDILIQLLGKLSLDNIPTDVSETLLSLENRSEETMSNAGIKQEVTAPCSSGDLLSSASSSSQSTKEVNHDISANNNVEKETFLSSIGLVSGSHRTVKDTELKTTKSSKQGYASSGDYSDSQYNLPLYDMQNIDRLCTTVNYSGETSITDGKSFQDLFNDTCDSKKLSEQRKYPSSDQLNDTLIYQLHELFNSHQGRVYDIRLNDLDENTKSCRSFLPFTTEDEFLRNKGTHSHVDSPSYSQTNDDVLYTDKIHDTNDKPVSSPDSGYDTSSCSSAISPSSPPISLESPYTLDIFGDTSDDELDSIVAAIVDYENSLMNDTDASQSNCNVPTLRNAKDPEDHKERILNFLKAPIYEEQSCSESSESKSSSEVVPKSFVLSDSRVPLPHFSTSRKSPSKSKEWKLGYEIKYAARNELQHSSLFFKAKPCEKNKILKQIQEDERALKRIKVIQLLDKKLKLKRTAVDDRENKRQRIQCKDSC